MRKLGLHALLLGVAAVVAAPAVMADITYTVNDHIGIGTVTGFIETDGTIGTLATSDFIDWDLVVNDGNGPADLLGPLSGNNSTLNITSNNVTGSLTALQFNFNGNGGLLNIFNTADCSPAEWSFETTGSGTACNGTVGNEEGIASVDLFGTGTYSMESGEVTFATVPLVAAPEPSTFGIALIGLLGVALFARKRIAG